MIKSKTNEEFNKFIRPIYVVGRVFLMWPARKKQKFWFIKEYILCFILFVCYSTVLYLAIPVLDSIREAYATANILLFIDICVTLSSLSMFYFTQIYNLSKRKQWKIMYEELGQSLNYYGCIKDRYKFYKESVCLVIFIIIYSIVEYVAFLIAANIDTLYYCTYAYPIFVLLMLLYLIFSILNIHCQIIVNINKKIKEMIKVEINKKITCHFLILCQKELNILARLHWKTLGFVRFLNKLYAPILVVFILFVFAVSAAYFNNVVIATMLMMTSQEWDKILTAYDVIWPSFFLWIMMMIVKTWVKIDRKVTIKNSRMTNIKSINRMK